MTVAVDVLMQRNRLWFSYEGHLGRVEGILGIELELEDEVFSLVESVDWTLHHHSPHPEIISRLSFLVQLETRRRTRHEAFELFLQSLESCS